MNSELINRLEREQEARQQQEYIERLTAAELPQLRVDRKATIEHDQARLRKILAPMGADHPARPEIEADLARLSADLDAVTKDLQLNRKDLLAQMRARRVTNRQVAAKSWPKVHPDKAVERLKKWVARGRYYRDDSRGDKAVRAAISSLIRQFPK